MFAPCFAPLHNVAMRSWALAMVAIPFAACGGPKTDPDGGGACGLSACNLAAATNSPPSSVGPDGGTFDCAYPQLTPYAPCLSEGDQNLRVTFLCADPDPPGVGSDSFTVAVTDGQGKPQPGLPLSVSLWMPQHCHGVQTQPVLTDNGDGTYSVANVYLYMPGVWQVTFALDGGYTPGCPSATSSSMQFYLPVGC